MEIQQLNTDGPAASGWALSSTDKSVKNSEYDQEVSLRSDPPAFTIHRTLWWYLYWNLIISYVIISRCTSFRGLENWKCLSFALLYLDIRYIPQDTSFD